MTFEPNYLTANHEQINQRLDNFLLKQLKGLPKSCLYRLLRQGKIRVNKKRKQPSYRLEDKDHIRLPTLKLSPITAPIIKPSLAFKKRLLGSVLFEDDNLLILNKAAGLAVHGGSGVNLGLIEGLRQMHPSYSFLELAHRLDRETSGCLVLAKKASILKSIHTLLRTGQIKKTYLMLVKGHWPTHLKNINIPLKKNQLKSGERLVKVSEAGKPTFSEFFVHQYFTETSLVETILHTGRTHQIRVHAQYAKCPIVGDEKYGDKTFNQLMRNKGIRRLFLHAHTLSFHLPVTKQWIDIKAPLPSELNNTLKDMQSRN